MGFIAVCVALVLQAASITSAHADAKTDFVNAIRACVAAYPDAASPALQQCERAAQAAYASAPGSNPSAGFSFVLDSLGRLSKIVDSETGEELGSYGYSGDSATPVWYRVGKPVSEGTPPVGHFTEADLQWIADHIARINDPNFAEADFNAMMGEFDAQWRRGGVNAATAGVLADTVMPETHASCIAKCDAFWGNLGVVCLAIGLKNKPWGAVCGAGVAAGWQICKATCPPNDPGPYEFVWCSSDYGARPLAGQHPELCGSNPDTLITQACARTDAGLGTGPRTIFFPGPITASAGGLLKNADCFGISAAGLPEWARATAAALWVTCNTGWVLRLYDEWLIYGGISDPQELARRACPGTPRI